MRTKLCPGCHACRISKKRKPVLCDSCIAEIQLIQPCALCGSYPSREQVQHADVLFEHELFRLDTCPKCGAHVNGEMKEAIIRYVAAHRRAPNEYRASAC